MIDDDEYDPEENPYEDWHDAIEKGWEPEIANKVPWQELITARETRGLSQRQLSIITKISPDKICNYELGKTKPNCSNLEKLADALECSCEFLFGNSTKIEENVQAYDAIMALEDITATHEQNVSKEEAIIKKFISQTEKRLLK